MKDNEVKLDKILQVKQRNLPIKDNLDVSGRHPVLQHWAVVKVVGRGASFQGAEGDPRARYGLSVGVGAQGLLFVGW